MKQLLMLSFVIFFSFTAHVYSQIFELSELSEMIGITSLEEALKDPEKVVKLELKKQKFTEFPKEIELFTNLQWLDLSKNKITELPEEIMVLKNLQYLDLSKNKLEILPKEIGEFPALKKLHLQQNNIIKLPSQIGKLENLEHLDLWDNELENFPDELVGLVNLKTLDLRNILINDEEQKRISSLLPDSKIYFSPSCACKY